MLKKLFIVLDTKNWMEKRLGPLEHDGGKLLRMLMNRLSIPRTEWVHDYCCLEDKAVLKRQIKETYDELKLAIRSGQVLTSATRQKRTSPPSNKEARSAVLDIDIRRLKKTISLNKPCLIVGMGGLPCEILTGASLVSTRAGTCWPTEDYGKVWITYSPDAALYDPKLVVDIYGVLARAAEIAGIETKFNDQIPMFNWEEYEHQRAA